MKIIRVVDIRGDQWFRTEATGWDKNIEKVKDRHKLNPGGKETYTEPTIKIRSEKFKRKRKTVMQFSQEERYIQTFSSLTHAATVTGVAVNLISRCCRGLQKKAGGYLWQLG